MSNTVEYQIRPARGSDSAGAAAVVRSVYHEYGFTWEEEGYHADLYDLEKHYLQSGDRFWVAENKNGIIVGTAASRFFGCIPGKPGEVVAHDGEKRIAGCDCSLDRLYVRPDCRRSGLGNAFMETVLRECRSLGRGAMEIWSDKRFTQAHALYGKFGAVQVGERICYRDPDKSAEWGMFLSFL